MVDSKWNIIQQVSKTYQFKTTLNIRSIDAEFWLHSSFLFFQKSGLLSVALRKIIKALKSHVTCYNLSLNSFSTNLRNLTILLTNNKNSTLYPSIIVSLSKEVLTSQDHFVFLFSTYFTYKYFYSQFQAVLILHWLATVSVTMRQTMKTATMMVGTAVL